MKASSLLAFTWLFVFASLPVAVKAAGPAGVENEIERLEHAVNDAYAANKLDEYFSYYADDLVAIFYDARTTLPAYRKFWSENVRAGNVVVSVKLSDLIVKVVSKRGVAVASYQIDVRNRRADGRLTDEHAFETDVWVMHGANWKIAHVQYGLATPPPN